MNSCADISDCGVVFWKTTNEVWIRDEDEDPWYYPARLARKEQEAERLARKEQEAERLARQQQGAGRLARIQDVTTFKRDQYYNTDTPRYITNDIRNIDMSENIPMRNHREKKLTENPKTLVRSHEGQVLTNGYLRRMNNRRQYANQTFSNSKQKNNVNMRRSHRIQQPGFDVQRRGGK